MTTQAKSSIKWGKYLFEMLSIILGVLVALGVDEWNQDRENSQRAKHAITNIHKEMAANLEVLEFLHPRNTQALEIIQEEVPGDTALEILPALQLQETAWRTLQNSGISGYIEYEDLFEIAQIYSIQSIYKNQGERFIQQFFETKSMARAMGRNLSEADIVDANLEVLTLMVHVEESLLGIISAYLVNDSLHIPNADIE